ncbi:unnamed protein product [Oppiella nova]|uniref:NR LBD domain-containing protein n=1 Tax=Oppiella nova TaxID=334625 RepID=A0A7R9M9W6_9ACAR|nr:unnamed protein product [Oppiella nova]CAG2173429.1 unnamed protein product [Oppiella nova]
MDSAPVSNGSAIQSTETEELNGFLNDLIENNVNISEQILEIESSVMPETSSIPDVTDVAPQDPQELAIAPVFPVINDYHSWNQLESIRVRELLSASNIRDDPLSNHDFKVYTFKQMMCETGHRMENWIKDTISFAKSLNGFKSFCADDQWTLIKNGCIEMCLMRHALYYNDEDWSNNYIFIYFKNIF